jgi:hypothetical protein
MRSPPWVVPRQAPPFGDKGWEKWSPWLCSYVPGFAKANRFLIAAAAEYDWRLFGSEEYHAKERKKVEDQLLDHMKKTVPEKYHEILTPDYGGKLISIPNSHSKFGSSKCWGLTGACMPFWSLDISSWTPSRVAGTFHTNSMISGMQTENLRRNL